MRLHGKRLLQDLFLKGFLSEGKGFCNEFVGGHLGLGGHKAPKYGNARSNDLLVLLLAATGSAKLRGSGVDTPITLVSEWFTNCAHIVITIT